MKEWKILFRYEVTMEQLSHAFFGCLLLNTLQPHLAYCWVGNFIFKSICPLWMWEWVGQCQNPAWNGPLCSPAKLYNSSGAPCKCPGAVRCKRPFVPRGRTIRAGFLGTSLTWVLDWGNAQGTTILWSYYF